MNYCNYISLKQGQNTPFLAMKKKAIKGKVFFPCQKMNAFPGFSQILKHVLSVFMTRKKTINSVDTQSTLPLTE